MRRRYIIYRMDNGTLVPVWDTAPDGSDFLTEEAAFDFLKPTLKARAESNWTFGSYTILPVYTSE